MTSRPCPACGSELSAFPRNPPHGAACPYCGFVVPSPPGSRTLVINAPIKSTIIVGGYKFCSERGESSSITEARVENDTLHAIVNRHRVTIAKNGLWVDGHRYGIIACDDRIHVSHDGSVSVNGQIRSPEMST